MPEILVKGKLKHIKFNAKTIAFMLHVGTEVFPDEDISDANLEHENRQIEQAMQKLRHNLSKSRHKAYLSGGQFQGFALGGAVTEPFQQTWAEQRDREAGVTGATVTSTTVAAPTPASPAPFQETWVEKRDREAATTLTPVVTPPVTIPAVPVPSQETWIEKRDREASEQQRLTAPIQLGASTTPAVNPAPATNPNIMSYDSLKAGQDKLKATTGFSQPGAMSYESIQEKQRKTKAALTRAIGIAPTPTWPVV